VPGHRHVAQDVIL